ncbi:hypothetical protein [Pseudomonas chlororaphis]|jgi:hypothetical protein|uniref:hypothetical protein n=2 Tax=Pseudomonas chlororaphis TaxID=587753 RepID=UPI00050D0EED|nr:hypothetical protein [Pseudomonas chlororaphis]AIS13208.1 hypothetical protein JM49_16570 [Pseudomonas chlororaphis subsp. aurantiaca]AZD42004.1 hypothetical protein C4K21_2930 [Pseudomonas chlororaphis subsp. aurantiaca]QIT22736.1 hypothetical protein HCN09_13685 [Pseudomonas chlororaphis subsp. aurantiaca]WDH06908.1 hypothetical protein PUP57_14815 [Pseudomonas chlororaphis]WDH10338.1 hypothetical protein PUP64_32200 [Pseudomonas chlororaphis]
MSNVSTADIVLASLGGVTFFGMIIVMGYYIYLAYTRMDSILDAVKNCSLINRYRFYLLMGPWGKMVMVGGVASCLLFSRYLIKHGELNGDDIDNFPEPLKSRLLMSQYISWVLLVSLFMEAIAVKVLRWQVQL